MIDRHGYRGYIGSRAYFGQRAPQHVQNLVIRDYCQRNGFTYLLSATEYAMEDCFMILEDVINEALKLEGVVFYTLNMLPRDKARRYEICSAFLDAGCTIHGAVENACAKSLEEYENLENLWSVRRLSEQADTIIQQLAATPEFLS